MTAPLPDDRAAFPDRQRLLQVLACRARRWSSSRP